MPRAAPSPAIRILASKNIEQTCSYRNDGRSSSSRWKRIALRTGRVHGENHRSTNNRGMNYGGSALCATTPCGLLPSRQVNRRAVCQRRKKRHCYEKLAKIFTNTQKPRIGRRLQGSETPRKRIAHGLASPRASDWPRPLDEASGERVLRSSASQIGCPKKSLGDHSKQRMRKELCKKTTSNV